MALPLLLLLALPVLGALYNAYCLATNYIKASKLGVPVVIGFVTPENPLWIAFQLTFSRIIDLFPFSAFSLTRHCRLGWEYRERYRTHAQLGDAFVLATPGRNWLHIGDAAAVADILGRSREFTHPAWMTAALGAFGPNIATAPTEDWARHRKLTATPFNEQKMALVWAETLRQADQMRGAWMAGRASGVHSTPDDTRTLALHVLAYTAFQKSYPFESISKTTFEDAKSLTYRDSIAMILENIFTILILPEAAFSIPFLPNSWKQIGWAVRHFREYMLKQVEDERRLIKEGRPGSGTLVSNLVRASNDQTTDGKSTNDDRSPRLKPFGEAEILGNIFVFNFAGHDTTAISLNYTMLLLVANPNVQSWVREELRHYLKDSDMKSWNYEEVFPKLKPKLKRSLAVLYETLRLYDPLPGVPKYTENQPAQLSIGDKTCLVPADTLVMASMQALHTYPRHWGPDSLEWRPQRWLEPRDPAPAAASPHAALEAETLLVPPKGAYFPWSDGARNCPGKKFAQVEHVAVMAALLRDHRADPVPHEGESMDDARRRVLGVVKNSTLGLLLEMRDPRSVGVRWSEVE